MMVIPPHSSTPRWVPTAGASTSSSTHGSGIGAAKAMATTKRKRGQDAADDEECGGVGEMGGVATRRIRLESDCEAHAYASFPPRPSLTPLQPAFNTHTLPTPVSERPHAALDAQMDEDGTTDQASLPAPTGLAWPGHPLHTRLPGSSWNAGATAAPLAAPIPPRTPSYSATAAMGGEGGMLPGGPFCRIQGGEEDMMAVSMDVDGAGACGGWNGLDFPASMFTLQLSRESVGHAHPYAAC